MSVKSDIDARLTELLSPSHLEVLNESNLHSVPPNSETHFNVVIVTDAFDGKRKVARHQQIYGALADLLEGPVHALALHTYTTAEWNARSETAPQSPDCEGGSKNDSREG